MTILARRATAFAFTTLASALLLVAAVGPATATDGIAAPVAQSGRLVA